MFTGLVEEVGKVLSLRRSSQDATLTIQAPKVCADLAVGDSVAVSGPCLTAIFVRGGTFGAEVSAETLRRTTLGRLAAGDPVNLERALRVGDRLGGHMVSGHVDAVGKVTEIRREGHSIRMTFQVPDELSPYIVEKGSIAIDGVSLTVAGVNQNTFWVALIPHTVAQTTLQLAKPGSAVNLEGDMLAKYVERLLQSRARGSAQ